MASRGIVKPAFRAAVAVGVAGLMAAGAVNALTVTGAYIFYSWTSPGSSAVSAPFLFNGGTTGYELTLNGAGVATAVTALTAATAPPPFPVFESLTFSSNTGTINPGEVAPNPNTEVGIWDDVGVVNEGPTDAALNLDYTQGASVVFNVPAGYSGLLIAEDAGLDPFRLEFSSNGSDFTTPYFDGFSEAARNALVGSGFFSLSDTSNPANMDQVFLFLFDETLPAFARITEIENYGGERLELDYVGVVPVPPAIWLLGSALTGLTMLGRRFRSKAA